MQFPKRVRNLVINGAFPMDDAERAGFLSRQKTSEIDFVYKPDGQNLADACMSRWRLYGAGADPKLITRYTVERFPGFGPFWYGHYAAFKYDHEPGLRKLTVRRLLMTNTGDQIYKHAQVARRIRPDFEYVELEGGGVDIGDQNPVNLRLGLRRDPLQVGPSARNLFGNHSPGATYAAVNTCNPCVRQRQFDPHRPA